MYDRTLKIFVNQETQKMTNESHEFKLQMAKPKSTERDT